MYPGRRVGFPRENIHIRKSQVLYADCFQRDARFRTPTAHILAVSRRNRRRRWQMSRRRLSDEGKRDRMRKGERLLEIYTYVRVYVAFYFILYFFSFSLSLTLSRVVIARRIKKYEGKGQR